MAPTTWQTLAVDEHAGFRVTFRITVHERGWAIDNVVAHFVDGAWEDMVSGGTHGTGRADLAAWRPGEGVQVFGTVGLDVFPDPWGEPVPLAAPYGFAAPGVRSVACGDREVEITSPVGAFIIVVLGARGLEVRPGGEAA